MLDSKVEAARLILLAGDEPALRQRTLSALIALGGADDFDRQDFQADSSQPLDWCAAASTTPFLSERRTVVVRHILRLDPDGQGVSLQGLPETARLILVADDESGDENKQKRLGTVQKRWTKITEDADGVSLNFKMEGPAVRAEINRVLVSLDKKMSPRAMDALLEMTNGSLTRSLEELEKLAIYVGSDPEIREVHVRELVVPSREWNIFKLANAIVAGQPREALHQLNILASSTSKLEDFAFRTIFPQLSRQFRLLWQARLCIDAKTSASAAPESVRQMFPSDTSLAKQSEAAQGAIMRNAKSVRIEGLRRCLELLGDGDAQIKGLKYSYSTRETLERMVLEMIEACTPVRSS